MKAISSERILEAVSTLQKCFAEESAPREIFGILLKNLVELTESESGFAVEITNLSGQSRSHSPSVRRGF
jgi:hypothetical protein